MKHYAEVGLLPPPLLTSPNMGYYAPECVDRIRLVRELQARRRLPLEVIARMLRDAGTAKVSRALQMSEAIQSDLLDALAGENLKPASRAELLAVEGVDERVLADLEGLELVRRLDADGAHYDAVSRKLVRAVGVMRTAGLNEASGFQTGDLERYRERIAALVHMEIDLFNERVPVRLDTSHAERLMQSGLGGASALVLAIRDRLLADVLRGAGA